MDADLTYSVYQKIYNLILSCSHIRSPKAFLETLAKEIKSLCDYDSVVIFYYDTAGRIANTFSDGTKPGWMETYLEYYIDATDDSNFAFQLSSPEVIEKTDRLSSNIIDWSQAKNSHFKNEYINDAGLKYTWAFEFYDMQGFPRATICLNRIKNMPFTKEEQEIITLALPLLINQYRNYFYEEVKDQNLQSIWEKYQLTSREKEIADMLCKGMKTKRISELLSISISTVRKHIEHIYKKVNVISQTELITRVLDDQN